MVYLYLLYCNDNYNRSFIDNKEWGLVSMRYKQIISRIEYYDLLNGDFSDISNFNSVDKLTKPDQFYKLLTITKGERIVLKKIIAWGYDGWDSKDPYKLKEIMLADYVHNIKYSPYDYKVMCI